jgi:glycogen(starch) synthase
MTPGHAGQPRVLLTTDAVGGVWTYTLDVARGFAAKGAIIDLAVLGPVPDDTQRNAAKTIPGLALIETHEPLEWCMPGPAALANCAERLAALAAECGATSVHLHSPSLLGDANWPAPVLVAIHSCVATWWRAVRGNVGGAPVMALPESLGWQAEATRRGLNRAAAVVAPSQAFAASICDIYDVQRPVIVVPNGSSSWVSPPAPARSGALAAGRLWDEGKNIAAVDRAAARLVAESAGIPVIAAGALSGPNGARITLHHAQPAGQLNAAQLSRLMARMTAFIAPAFYEPFGLAILEAARAGMALVLGDIPTLRELWNGAAIFVAPADDAALAATITRLHAVPELAATMGARARRRAARYDIETTISALWDVHARLNRLAVLEMA